MEKKIGFKDLNLLLKIVVISSLIFLIIFFVPYIIGFMVGYYG